MRHISKVLLIMAVMASAVFSWESAEDIKKFSSGVRWGRTYQAPVSTVGSNSQLLILTGSSAAVGSAVYTFKFNFRPEYVGAVAHIMIHSDMKFTNAFGYTNGGATGSNVLSSKSPSRGTSPCYVFHSALVSGAAGGAANYAHTNGSSPPTLERTYVFTTSTVGGLDFTVPSIMLDPAKYYILQISNGSAVGTNLNYTLNVEIEKTK